MSISNLEFEELTNRVSALEEENSHLQRDLDELNSVLTEVNLEHDVFRKAIKTLSNKIETMSAASQSNNQDNPHLGANR